MERPSTSSTLPMIDPVMEAFTTLIRPLERAMPAMISSAAFPKVALSNAPRPSPTRPASVSVARPIQPATGMMPRAEQTKSAVGLMPPGQKRRRIASGTKIRSQSRESLSFRGLGISRLRSANQPVGLPGVNNTMHKSPASIDSLIIWLCVHSLRRSGDRLRHTRARASYPLCQMYVWRHYAVRILAETSRARGYRSAARW